MRGRGEGGRREEGGREGGGREGGDQSDWITPSGYSPIELKEFPMNKERRLNS